MSRRWFRFPVALVRIDPATGESKEIFHVDRQTLSAPTVAGGMLLVGGSNHVLHALDAVTGNKKWDLDTGHNILAIRASEKFVYVGAGPLLLALDAATGAVRWKHENDTATGDLLIDDAAVIFNSLDGPVAVEGATGEIRWRLNIQWGYFVFSHLIGRRVCVWKPDEIFVVETERGKTLWQSAAELRLTAPGAIPSPARSDGKDVLFQLRGDPGNANHWSLHALDAGSGKSLWTADLGEHQSVSARTIVSDQAACCVFEDTMCGISLATGKPIWQIPNRSDTRAAHLTGRVRNAANSQGRRQSRRARPGQWQSQVDQRGRRHG